MTRAPGCFGVPSVYTPQSKCCQTCQWAESCSGHALAVVTSMGDEELSMTFTTMLVTAGVSVPKRTVTKRSAALEHLPVNVAKMLRDILRHKDAFIAAVEAGKNPFDPTKKRSAHIALELLLRGHLTQAQLRDAYCRDIGWKKTSATVQASVMFRVFLELGVATGSRGGIDLSPDFSQNTMRLLRR